MQIALEGIRNARHHGHAHSGSTNVEQLMGTINIKIDDDGIGFGDAVRPSWAIASSVADLGGHLAVKSEAMGAQLEIRLPTAQS